ncbi:hypothetical protein SRABI118_02706 [Massilia sp. Bi118]|uniref:Ig-like domain-containing protein n=1 Tax=Massilia sp. Bi118 TaxID=2822346 RepID=UPI001DFC7B11|nr:Ig-like domain-containing protein [Massilia sp. Bi118]CAH0240659.1 hypothetical protein SRABI118_02706 [Massilia sp. Bi118]
MMSSAFDPASDNLVIATRKEIVFIEDNVADIDILIRGIGSGKEIVILDSSRDGLHQIAEVMAGRSGIDAVHIVSHGSAGVMSLGTLMLDAGSLDAYKDDLQAIGHSMSADGDILLYGCDIGAGNSASFVQQMAIATGADVAASNDATGAASLGGDWELEVVSGQVETAVVVDAQIAALYRNVLNINPGKIEFGADGTFTSGKDPDDMVSRDTDVIFRVNNNSSYALHIDGQDTAVSAYDSYVGSVFAAARAPESEIKISFAAGQAFTPQRIGLSNWSTAHTNQTLEIRGFDSHYNQVGTTVTVNLLTTDFTATDIGLEALGGQIVKMLKITATTNGNMIDYLMIDSLTVGTAMPYPAMVSYVDAVQGNGSYKAGATIDIRVNFDNVVDVTGTPRLLLETGATDRYATYVSGTGSTALIFRYTVQAGDKASDLDYKDTAIDLNGGTIKAYLSTNNAIVTLPTPGNNDGSLSSNRNIVIDTDAPTVAITTDHPVMKDGDSATIRFNFSEDPGASFTLADVDVSGGSGGALSSLSGSGLVRTATFMANPGMDGSTVSIAVTSGKYADAAGNVNSGASSVSFTVDNVVPNAPSAPDLAGSADSGSSNTDNVTNKNTGLVFTGTAEAGVTAVKLYESDGVTEIASTTVMTGTSYTVTTTGTLANGMHTIEAKAFDAAGNFSGLVTGPDVVIDTTPPTLSITSSASTLKAGETATITFTFSEDPGTSFSWDGSAGSIAVSGGTLSAISGSGTTRTATFTPSADTDAGSASISVLTGTYKDLAGNDGVASNNLALNYDTLAPSKPSVPSLAINDDSGASNSDYVTNKNPLTFSGTADSGATVKLYDGATEIASTTASGGNYSFTLAGLAEGNHTFAVVAVDAAGNTGPVSDALAVTVDRTPPSTTIASAAMSNDTGSSATDMVVRDAQQTISGTLSANLAAGERVLVSLDNGATWTPASASAGANTWELAGVTLAGSGTLKMKVEDLAGNGGTAYAHAYSLDQSAPAASSMPDLDAGSDSGASSTDNITGVTLPSFSGTAEVGAKVVLYDGGIEIGSDVAADGTWHITTSSTPLTQRVHYITAEVIDLAGNHSATSPVLELDVRTAGPATSVAGMALSVDSGTAGDFITNQASQTISGTLSANLGSGEHVEVSRDGGATWNTATGATGSNAWSISTTLLSGAHDIKVRVVDAVDNAGPVHTQAYTLDSTAPTVSISSNLATLKAGDTATITFTFSEDPGSTFSWDGSAGDVTVSGGTLSAISGSGLTRTATFTPAANTNAGTASIGISAGSYQDTAGNNGLAGSSPSITFDTLAPAASSAPDLAAASDKGTSSTDNLTNATSLVFTGTAEAGATVKLYDSDGSTEIGSGTATGGNWTIATSTLGAGSHSVTAKVFDAAGNVSAASSATTVTIDTAAPMLAISSDAGQLKIGETATITFTFSEDPGATFTWDGTAGDVTVSGGTLSAISGTGTVRTATFTPSANTNGGSASISVSAGSYRDAAGNDGAAGATPSLHFDTLAPGAPSTPDLDAASDTGSSAADNFTADTTPTFSGTAESGATVTLYDGATTIGSVVAAGGAWQITSDRALAAGAHSITAQAVDAAGNAGAASSGLTVQIITGGPATGVKDMALSLDSGPAGDFVTNTAAQTISGHLDVMLATGERVQVSLDGGTVWNDAASSTGSDAWSIATTLAAGAHDIRVRVIDAVDNTGPVHIQAYTLDSVKPAVSITSDVAQLKAGQTAAITFTFSEDPGASFDAGDIVVSGGTLSAIAGNGLVRTAVFTPSADTNGGAASIAIKADSYEDAAGNLGSAGAPPSLSFDTLAPAAPSTPDLHKNSDSGVSDSDDLTHDTTLVFTGSAESGATVRLYDSDGSTEIGHATAAGGIWAITTSALAEGSHAITAKTFDAAGNASAASGAITVTVDASSPAALAAPVLAAASDSGVPGNAITKAATPTFSGSAEALAQVTLYDGATVIGSVQADAQGAWQITAATLPDGVHAISARQVDLAGNASGAGAVFSLTVDTVAPAAPAAPSLKASSDTGNIGDGLTENTIPVIEGTALADTLVTLYETVGGSKVKLGAAMADGSGKWSIATTGLSTGAHLLSATQTDAAGNESAASAGFTLRIAEPPMPIDLVDGMPVQVFPISLPGNVPGTAVSIPVVGAGRTETSGQPGVADIPLVKSGQGAPILLAQLPAGYGLSASGANLPAANAGELLIAAIKAATPSHAPSDQGHLTGKGQGFLAGLGSSGSLLVETVKPVSSAAPEGVLTLSGPAPGAGQSTALVIDTGGLAAGATIALQQVNFAAVIGAANVTAGSNTILSGDGASQHFTVAAGGTGSVFAGGGSDVLGIAAPATAGPAPAAGVALLHGGAANDAATFSGARADYNIEFHNGYVMVSTKAAPDVKAMVVNVEQLQFSDASIAVQNNADMGTLAGIYQTVLGRQADVMGIEYWANVHQAGASWGAIALSMIASSEHAASHEGFNGVAAHDLALLYAAIFDREADAGGMAYWTEALGRGLTLEQVASNFVESAEMVGHQRAAADWDFIVG